MLHCVPSSTMPQTFWGKPMPYAWGPARMPLSNLLDSRKCNCGFERKSGGEALTALAACYDDQED